MVRFCPLSFLCRRHVVDVERRYGLFSITDKVTFYSVAFLSLLTAILQKKKTETETTVELIRRSVDRGAHC